MTLPTSESRSSECNSPTKVGNKFGGCWKTFIQNCFEDNHVFGIGLWRDVLETAWVDAYIKQLSASEAVELQRFARQNTILPYSIT